MDISERKLTWAAQLGVEHVIVNSPITTGIQAADGTWSVEAIRRVSTNLRRYGMDMCVLALDLSSCDIADNTYPDILLAGPKRDAQIDVIKQNIRAAGEAGVPCLKYNLTLLGVPRTGKARGRGGARYSHFDVREWQDDSLTLAGRISPEQLWDRIAYFVERVIPVAEESGVRMACHPNDPLLPPEGLRGAPHVLGSVDGLKRFVDVFPSKYHGLNFCQGTISEGLAKPGVEIFEAIRYFASRQKIFMVHFRNIVGGYLRFDEVYPDNGDVDMYRALRTYRDAGYDGPICPDHVPESDVDPDGERQYSFCWGYTRALLQVLESDSKEG